MFLVWWCGRVRGSVSGSYWYCVCGDARLLLRPWDSGWSMVRRFEWSWCKRGKRKVHKGPHDRFLCWRTGTGTNGSTTSDDIIVWSGQRMTMLEDIRDRRTLSLIKSLTLLSSSIAPSQFPERISAANLPHAAAVFMAASVDYISILYRGYYQNSKVV